MPRRLSLKGPTQPDRLPQQNTNGPVRERRQGLLRQRSYEFSFFLLQIARRADGSTPDVGTGLETCSPLR
jgi:hypothetical protein